MQNALITAEPKEKQRAKEKPEIITQTQRE